MSGSSTWRRKAFGAVALVGGLFWLAAWWDDAQKTEADRVREAISDVATGAGDADLAATLAPVSESYNDGQVQYDGLKMVLFQQFAKRGPVKSVLGPIRVDLSEGDAHAVASFSAVIADGVDVGGLDLVPDSRDAVSFEIELRKEDGEWRIVSHERLR